MRSASAALDAIPSVIAARDVFLARVADAEGDRAALADLMAEAIDLHLAANGLEAVGRDGRVRLSMEDIAASHCLRAARDAWLRDGNPRRN